MTTQDLKDTVDRETRQTDNTNMLGGTNLMIDPKYSDFIGKNDNKLLGTPLTSASPQL